MLANTSLFNKIFLFVSTFLTIIRSFAPSHCQLPTNNRSNQTELHNTLTSYKQISTKLILWAPVQLFFYNNTVFSSSIPSYLLSSNKHNRISLYIFFLPKLKQQLDSRPKIFYLPNGQKFPKVIDTTTYKAGRIKNLECRPYRPKSQTKNNA